MKPLFLGAPGYLCRLCGLKGHARSLYDNRLLLLSSSKAKTYYTSNFVLGHEERGTIVSLLFLILIRSLLLLRSLGGGLDGCL